MIIGWVVLDRDLFWDSFVAPKGASLRRHAERSESFHNPFLVGKEHPAGPNNLTLAQLRDPLLKFFLGIFFVMIWILGHLILLVTLGP